MDGAFLPDMSQETLGWRSFYRVAGFKVVLAGAERFRIGPIGDKVVGDRGNARIPPCENPRSPILSRPRQEKNLF